MTETKPTTEPSESGGPMGITPGLAEGRSRLLLFVGLAGFAIGNLVSASLVTRGATGTVAVALGLNTVGKLTHYRSLSISRSDRAKLAVSWVLVALTVVGLLTNYTYARYGSGDGSFFWSLAAAGLGFGLLHMAAQSEYLPPAEEPTDD